MIGGSILKVLGIDQTVKALAGIVTGSFGTIFGHAIGIKYTVDGAIEDASGPDPVPTEITDMIAQLGDTITLVLFAVAVLALIVILRR